MNTVQSQWDSFSANVIPAAAPEIQKEEMKRAFYAGAAAMFQLQVQVAAHDEATAMRMLTTISGELDGWIRDFAKQHGIS